MKKKTLSLLLAVAMIVSIIPAAFAAARYTDVSSDAWYAEPIDYVSEHGLMVGVGDNKFAPNDSMTRAMVVQVLYRMAGTPHVHADNPFKDVKSSDWFYHAVLWAYANDVTDGTSATTFSPNDNITREQLVALVYKYAKSTGMAMTYTDVSGFADAGKISSWAVDAFKWAVNNGIISGVGHNRIAPLANATRAECAAILARFDKMVNGEQKPVEPTDPSEPVDPSVPTEPSEPSDPSEPSEPVEPTDPSKPDPETCDHDWTVSSDKKPTCDMDGYRRLVCSKCGEVKWEYPPALGHDWDEGTVTKEPTATEEGVTTYTCKRCGKTREESIPVLSDCEHTWGEPVRTEPTCEEDGSIIYTCTKCGAQRKTILKATGHDYSPVEQKEATCTEPGFVSYECNICGKTDIVINEDPLGHDWDDGITTKEPTGSEDGIMTYTCNSCGETREEVIPATGEFDHDWEFHDEWDEQVLVKEAWDEQVLVKEAWEEQVLVKEAYDEEVLVKEAYDEQVLVKEAWDEQKLVKEAWDEQVLVREAYDEQVVVKEAWDEQVLVKEAWDEEVLVREAYDEEVTTKVEEFHTICNGCGKDFGPGEEGAEAASDHIMWDDTGKCNNYHSEYVWVEKTETVHHDAEYKTVHHDAEYKTVHHEAEYETVHHEAEYETIHHEAEYKTVHHEAEYKTVHHEAEYKTVYHEAEYKTVHHDAEYKTVHHDAYWECTVCGRKVFADANHKPDDHGCNKP